MVLHSGTIDGSGVYRLPSGRLFYRGTLATANFIDGTGYKGINKKADGTTALDAGGLDVQTNYPYPTWNNDFLLASTYQMGETSAQTVAQRKAAGNTNVCDEQITTINTAFTTDTLVSKAMNAKTKCTYFLKADAGAGAPAFKITNADSQKF